MWWTHWPTFNKWLKKNKNMVTLHILTHGAMWGCGLTSLMVCINNKIFDIRERIVTTRSEIYTRNMHWGIGWIWKCYLLQRLWSSTQHCPPHRRPITLLGCSNRSWTDVWWTLTNVWHVLAKRQQTNIECHAKKLHAYMANDFAWHVQTIENEPLFLSKYLRI